MLQPRLQTLQHGEQRRKTSLSWELTKKKRRQYENNQIVLFGTPKCGIEGSQQEHVWESSLHSTALVWTTDLQLMLTEHFPYSQGYTGNKS